MKRLFSFLVSFFLIFWGIYIINTKIIPGSRGSPDLYVGNWAYLIGGIFVIFGLYAFVTYAKSVINEDKKE